STSKSRLRRRARVPRPAAIWSMERLMRSTSTRWSGPRTAPSPGPVAPPPGAHPPLIAEALDEVTGQDDRGGLRVHSGVELGGEVELGLHVGPAAAEGTLVDRRQRGGGHGHDQVAGGAEGGARRCRTAHARDV